MASQILYSITGQQIYIKYCWRYEEVLDWCKMECLSGQTTSLVALTCSPLPIPARNFTSNPVVFSTLKIGTQFPKHFKLYDFVLYGPLRNNHHLILPLHFLNTKVSGNSENYSLMVLCRLQNTSIPM